MDHYSGANSHLLHQQQPPFGRRPVQQHPWQEGFQTSLTLGSSGPAGSPVTQELRSNSQDSPVESASSRDTWPVEINHPNTANVDNRKAGESEIIKPQVIRRSSNINKLSLHEIAQERFEKFAERMKVMPDELMEELKSELRAILEGTPASLQREEFLYLQKLVQERVDVTTKTIVGAHHVQLEILVAINTCNPAYLRSSIPQSSLIDILLYRKCQNIHCGSDLPADGCSCGICMRKGFCNSCMCMICNKFDFEVNTCRWISCDVCSHWTHTDCAFRVGQILTGQSVKNGVQCSEMVYVCLACCRSSDLFGWVKYAFQDCALEWDRDVMFRELEFVSKIFRFSEDPKGKKLYSKLTELLEKLKSGIPESMACRLLLLFLQELETDSPKFSEAKDGLISPQEAFNHIATVVQETMTKMEMVEDAKIRKCKRARLAVEACDHELEEKAREVAELKIDRQRQKQQIDELESIISLKQAEAEMFQRKAEEAKQEAERLHTIVLAKSEKAGQDYVSLYLKQRLDEAEAEKQYLFEKLKLQETETAAEAGISAGSGYSTMPSKVQDLLLKNFYNGTEKSEGQHSR